MTFFINVDTVKVKRSIVYNEESKIMMFSYYLMYCSEDHYRMKTRGPTTEFNGSFIFIIYL